MLCTLQSDGRQIKKLGFSITMPFHHINVIEDVNASVTNVLYYAFYRPLLLIHCSHIFINIHNVIHYTHVNLYENLTPVRNTRKITLAAADSE